MRIIKGSTIAVEVDIQERLFPFIHENEKFESNAVRLINGLKALGIPMVVTEQYPKGIGKTTPPIMQALGEFYNPIEKMSFSCCGEDSFLDAIGMSGRRNVILFGMETHVCLLQTCLDLIELGYRPVVIEDCCSSRLKNNHDIAIARMRQEGAVISTYESILMEICQVSGTDEFREISHIIK